jgi:hypothetical protein
VLGSGVPTAVPEGDADGVDVAGAVLAGGGASGIAGEGVAVGAVSRWTGNHPMVLAHARALLYSTEEGATAYIDADVTDPEHILAAAAKTLDFSRPTALILSNILGHVADHDQARAIVNTLMDALPSGSYLSVNDGSRGIDPVFEQAQDAYNNSGAVPCNLRSIDEISAFFDGLELVEPGVVSVTEWRPEAGSGAPEIVAEHGGLARKP